MFTTVISTVFEKATTICLSEFLSMPTQYLLIMLLSPIYLLKSAPVFFLQDYSYSISLRNFSMIEYYESTSNVPGLGPFSSAHIIHCIAQKYFLVLYMHINLSDISLNHRVQSLSALCAGQSSFSTQNSLIHVSINTSLHLIIIINFWLSSFILSLSTHPNRSWQMATPP